MNDESLDSRLRNDLSLPESQGPVGRSVQTLILDALEAQASDIHLSPSPEGLLILYRIDGVLQTVSHLDASVQDRIVNKIKVLSGLLTYRKDLAQDGKIPAEKVDGAAEIRISIFPTVHGEKVVLRLFTGRGEKLDLEWLGLDQEVKDELLKAARKPDGVILLTGPSGSGKTTTIYSLLSEMTKGAHAGFRHVVTIEDPVERNLPGITQTQVHPPTGITFAYSLRALLRQDPNVIMVGEIRDHETADVAMEAGLTGHLVISTVHSGTAVGVITRLLEMGVETHVLSSSLSCVLAQRLVRRLCDRCKQSNGSCYAAVGCEQCRGTGYHGRQVFGELLVLGDELRQALSKRASTSDLQRIAEVGGMASLERQGRKLVESGVTTTEEFQRVLGKSFS